MAYTRITLSQLRTRLRTKWDATTGVPNPFWTAAEADFAINEALQWYNLYTGLWRRRLVFPTVADQVYYTIPGTLVFNARMEYNGQPLVMSSLTDLDNGTPGWEGQTTATSGVPDTPQVWAPVGMTGIALWPADAVGQNALTVDGIHTTPTLTLDADTVDLDDSEIDALLGEALWISTFKDGSRLATTEGWHQEFLRTVMQHNGRLAMADAFRPSEGMDLSRQARPLSPPPDEK